MPALKPISGHTPCKGIVSYLTKGGRDLAEDFLNCSAEDRHGRPVWAQMDAAREWAGNGRPVGGRAARTYEHFILSPDPRDHVTVEQLRSLATEWAGRYFGDYQCAIYYHDDNDFGIPHAHVVVNNTNLVTGRRLSPTLTAPFEREIWDGLQGMAAARGLRAFDSRGASAPGAGLDAEAPSRCATAQRDYRSRPVREMRGDGRFSWVDDVRERARCAAMISTSEGQFLRECETLDLRVRVNGRGDFVYARPGRGTWQVSGVRLGSDWTRWGVGRRLALDAARHVAKPEGERLEAIERAMAILSREGSSPQVIGTARGVAVSAADVSAMLSACVSVGAGSVAELREAAGAAPAGPARSDAYRALRTALALGCLPAERPDDPLPRGKPRPRVEGDVAGASPALTPEDVPARGAERGSER